MEKARKIIQLINLLSHRRAVTLKEIQEACGIPRRTAFRYLNTISEVNIPVYFDDALRGYRLRDNQSFGLDDVNESDVALIMLALDNLKHQVNEDYAEQVDRVVTKLCVRQPAAVEQLREYLGKSGNGNGKGKQPKIDQSLRITEAVMMLAATLRRRVRVTFHPAENETKSVDLSGPTLQFQGGWVLRGMSAHGPREIDMDSISKVGLV